VRILPTPETITAGFANRVGQCLGFTTPSVTGVEVIGASEDDFAFSVLFDGGPQVWFAPSAVEPLGFEPGQLAQIGDKTFVRSANGDWVEAPGDSKGPPRDIPER